MFATAAWDCRLAVCAYSLLLEAYWVLWAVNSEISGRWFCCLPSAFIARSQGPNLIGWLTGLFLLSEVFGGWNTTQGEECVTSQHISDIYKQKIRTMVIWWTQQQRNYFVLHCINMFCIELQSSTSPDDGIT